MANQDTWTKDLWTPHSVEETQSIYRDWAATYDADVLKSGYVTPQRVAAAMVECAIPLQSAVLDFGCGTGLSGVALSEVGYSTIDGTDISPEMLDQAHSRGVYRDVVLGDAGSIAFEAGAHLTIVATGVVSAGAAPPETLDLLVEHLPVGGFCAFSFNDPSLEMGTYAARLDGLIQAETITVLFQEHGPHLPEKGMGSNVYVVQKV